MIKIVAKFLSVDFNNSFNFIIIFPETKSESGSDTDSDSPILVGSSSLDKKGFIDLNDKIRNKHKSFSPINIKKDSIFIKVKNINNITLVPRGHYTINIDLSLRKRLNKTYYNFILRDVKRINFIKVIDINEL